MDCFVPLAVSDLFGAGISIEIARSGSDAAIQVNPPQSSAPIVRTQSVGSTNGLPRRAIALLAVSESFLAPYLIETARASARGGPSDFAAKFSPDRQDSVR